MENGGKFRIFVDSLRRFDAYPKTLDDFRVKTFGGATITIVSAIIMIFLFLSELRDYLTPEINEELLVDTSRGHKLRINIDLVFPKVACSFLAIDATDSAGEQPINIEHNIYKRRLDLDGKPIEEPKKEEKLGNTERTSKNVTVAVAEVKCGSCYGAETEEIKCCSTCEEVRQAYRIRGWAIKNPAEIDQCKNDHYAQEMNKVFDESCQIYGYLEVNRVGGSFHIAPGRSFTINHVHVHDVQPYSSTQFNMTHTIRHLSFGMNIPGKTNPIDGTKGIAVEGSTMFQYYIKIVPTCYVRQDGYTLYTNQFSVTRHEKVVSIMSGESGMSGVFFSYELTPMMVKYTEKEKSLGHFLTGVCAIIGGVFTVAGLIDSAIYHSTRVLQKKMELGKVT